MLEPEAAILVRRGAALESAHRVLYVIADDAGRVVAAGGGAPTTPVFPRSAVKPIQALPLVESGAAARFGLSAAELALACASHGGEPMHAGAVAAWLARLGLSVADLACGAHAPSDAAAAAALAASGEPPSALHNNCSGKHAGMLTLALHLGVPTAGYLAPDHPVQRLIAAAQQAMASLDVMPEPAVDGCGIPTFALPLAGLATALARLARPDGLPPERAAACRQIVAAMQAHPELVAGTGRPCTLIMQAAPQLLVKTGAEGVYAAAWPAHGLGVALKVVDGATRAAVVALLALLTRLDAVPPAALAQLAPLARPILRNHAGRVVGRIEPQAGWPDWPTVDRTAATPSA